VCVCVGGGYETEKGDDSVSQQGDEAIKENPKNTRLSPLTTHSALTLAKAQHCVCVCVYIYIYMSVSQFILQSTEKERLLGASDLHLLDAAGATFVFASSAWNQRV